LSHSIGFLVLTMLCLAWCIYVSQRGFWFVQKESGWCR
jgi:hypothetical protein